MERRITFPDGEAARAERLPQADARKSVDAGRLDTVVQDMYRHVAREQNAELHFETGRGLAEQLGYPAALLDRLPAESLASFAGVGHHLDLARLRPGERVLDLGSGSGTDVFCAAAEVGPTGRVVGVDFTDEQLSKARRLAGESCVCERFPARRRFPQVEFVEARIEALPFEPASFDVVISNGVINLSLLKRRVFAEAARVLRTGGRLALADIVSARPLKESTRRNVDPWAACVAGAIPRTAYLATIESAGFSVGKARANDYRFASHRARQACGTYGVESLSLAATKLRLPARLS